jgi:hypothetical protein
MKKIIYFILLLISFSSPVFAASQYLVHNSGCSVNGSTDSYITIPANPIAQPLHIAPIFYDVLTTIYVRYYSSATWKTKTISEQILYPNSIDYTPSSTADFVEVTCVDIPINFTVSQSPYASITITSNTYDDFIETGQE